MSEALWRCDAFELARLLETARTDAPELLALFTARIERLNPSLNAVVCRNEAASDDARASAERRARGAPLSRIDGVPILVKDNLAVRGMPATWGSRLFAQRIVARDEVPVQRLRDAGVVIVGKTNVPEFTIEGYTANAMFGVTPNPWDRSLTPGGSSGGSVAAVAAGMIPWSIGTDGGGSIRRPAAYTGLVGLKPSIGRIARGGGLPQLLLDMEVVGPITRSVRDSALLFDVLAGPDARDHRSLRFATSQALAHLHQPPGPLRVLAVERFGDAPLDPAIGASFRRMMSVLASLGHRVEPGELPLDIAALNEHWASIGHIGLGSLLQREPQMRELASAKYVQWGETPYDATHLLNLFELIASLRNRASEVFERIDVIATPTCAAMPWSTEIAFPAEIDGRAVGPRGSAIYTGWVNAIGHPAISVPGQADARNLPIGTQFVGGIGTEELLLRLAQQIETAKSWLGDWPGLADTGGA